jgi:hypothetical protein
MEDGSEKNMLIESYGIPHFCDERKKFYDDKKDEYAREKQRIEALKSGSDCPDCSPGYCNDASGNIRARLDVCGLCGGVGKITAAGKKMWLYRVRQRIWPGIGESKPWKS